MECLTAQMALTSWNQTVLFPTVTLKHISSVYKVNIVLHESCSMTFFSYNFQFILGGSQDCLHRSLRCDDYENCDDGSDELNCDVQYNCRAPHKFFCKDTNICIDAGNYLSSGKILLNQVNSDKVCVEPGFCDESSDDYQYSYTDE